jgi:hypothetical protein
VPGQSAYNPVEQSMATLSGKLAGIELDAFAHGNHLGSINGKVVIVDEDLGRHNFRHVGEHLCELWRRNNINGHPVVTTYVEEHIRTDFLDIEEESWDWIDRHAQICKYSLDIRKCKDRNCCSEPRAPEIYDILSANNGFLPPVIKGCDSHFLNLVHSLEYFGENLPGYDKHCPSISKDSYPKFVCRECSRYYPTKVFLKLHIKMTYSNEKASKRRVTNKETESSLQNYRCNIENIKDNEISNYEVRNVQVFQKEKPAKKGKGKLCQQKFDSKTMEKRLSYI